MVNNLIVISLFLKSNSKIVVLFTTWVAIYIYYWYDEDVLNQFLHQKCFTTWNLQKSRN